MRPGAPQQQMRPGAPQQQMRPGAPRPGAPQQMRPGAPGQQPRPQQPANPLGGMLGGIGGAAQDAGGGLFKSFF
jgi:hypothetical protein